MKNKIRLDELVVNNGLADTIKQAQAVIIEGRIIVDTNVIKKPGNLLDLNTKITLKEKNPYVSRGGLKLESALKNFSISVNNKVCMDIGASTGGFTDCLLKHGAIKIYAIDAGRNQLDYKLKSDKRVISIEGMNFRYFSSNYLKEQVEFVTIDVSFISLTKILPVLIKFLPPNSEILALVKPQFEAIQKYLVKGVVKDSKIRHKIIEQLKSFIINKTKLKIEKEMPCPIKGPKGNVEHFLWLKN